MRPTLAAELELAPELESIAAAAAELLRAQTGGNAEAENEQRTRVAHAATAAIAAGAPLGEIAEAERTGQARARTQLGPDMLRRVERATRRKREADSEHEQAIVRATRLGLAHRDIAAAARLAHGTVRAIIARVQTFTGQEPPPPDTDEANNRDAGQP